MNKAQTILETMAMGSKFQRESGIQMKGEANNGKSQYATLVVGSSYGDDVIEEIEADGYQMIAPRFWIATKATRIGSTISMSESEGVLSVTLAISK